MVLNQSKKKRCALLKWGGPFIFAAIGNKLSINRGVQQIDALWANTADTPALLCKEINNQKMCFKDLVQTNRLFRRVWIIAPHEFTPSEVLFFNLKVQKIHR